MFSDIGYMAIVPDEGDSQSLLLKTANKNDLKIVFERKIDYLAQDKYIPLEFIEELILYAGYGFHLIQINKPDLPINSAKAYKNSFMDIEIYEHCIALRIDGRIDFSVPIVEIGGRDYVSYLFINHICTKAYMGYILKAKNTAKIKSA